MAIFRGQRQSEGNDAASIARRYRGQIVDVWVRSWGGPSHFGRFYAGPKTLYSLDYAYRPGNKWGEIRIEGEGRPGPITQVRRHVITARDAYGDDRGNITPGKTDAMAVEWAMTNLAEGLLEKRWAYDKSLEPYIRVAYKRMRGERLRQAEYGERSYAEHVQGVVDQWLAGRRDGRAVGEEGARKFLNHLQWIGFLPGATDADRNAIGRAFIEGDREAILARIRRFGGRMLGRGVPRGKAIVGLDVENSAGLRDGARRMG